MTVYKARDVDSVLKKKGFQKKPSGSHIKYQLMNEDGGKTMIWTMVSHNGQEIGDNLLKAMSQQLKLSTKEFCKMLDCNISGPEYLQMLRDRGILR